MDEKRTVCRICRARLLTFWWTIEDIAKEHGLMPACLALATKERDGRHDFMARARQAVAMAPLISEKARAMASSMPTMRPLTKRRCRSRLKSRAGAFEPLGRGH